MLVLRRIGARASCPEESYFPILFMTSNTTSFSQPIFATSSSYMAFTSLGKLFLCNSFSSDRTPAHLSTQKNLRRYHQQHRLDHDTAALSSRLPCSSAKLLQATRFAHVQPGKGSIMYTMATLHVIFAEAECCGASRFDLFDDEWLQGSCRS